MQIVDLADRPEHLQTLAQWYHNEWSHLVNFNLEQRIQALTVHLASNPLPKTFIALDGQVLLGGLCIVDNDLEYKNPYTPWLSRVYIDSKVQQTGLGTQLIHHAIAYVKALGHTDLYLLTEHSQHYFSRFGWQHQGVVTTNYHRVSLMKLNLFASNKLEVE